MMSWFQLGIISCLSLITVYGQNKRSTSQLPGFRCRVTQKGIDYGARLGVEMLMENVQNIIIPDFHVSVATTTMSMTDIVIKEFPEPTVRVSIMPKTVSYPGGLKIDATNMHPTVDTNIKITQNWGLFTSTKNGSLTALAKNLSIHLETQIGIDRDGRPFPTNIQCLATGDVEFSMNGDFTKWSTFFNMVYSTMKNQIKSAIFSQVCENVKHDVNKLLETELPNVPMTAIIEEDYVFDYHLLNSPEFTQNYLETKHQGGFFLVNGSTTSPFSPSSIPTFSRHAQKMVYLYITDYVANTGWYAALLSDDLQFQVTENMTEMPAVTRTFLSTSCPGKVCLGTIFPQLSWLYPDTMAEVDIRAVRTKIPFIKVKGRTVEVKSQGVAEFFIPTTRTRDAIFSVNVTLSGSVDLNIVRGRLIFNLTKLNVKTDMKHSNLGTLLSLTELIFDSFINTATQTVIFPFLRGLGLGGVDLDIPDVPELKFIDPVIFYHNIQGVMVIGTDIQYTTPRANTADVTTATIF